MGLLLFAARVVPSLILEIALFVTLFSITAVDTSLLIEILLDFNNLAVREARPNHLLFSFSKTVFSGIKSSERTLSIANRLLIEANRVEVLLIVNKIKPATKHRTMAIARALISRI